MSNRRIQLSLYVAEPQAAKINKLRELLDPVQSGLIPAHVTLCREDEMESISLDDLKTRLRAAPMSTLVLSFGRPQAFFSHGVLLPCETGAEQFAVLRECLLGSFGVSQHLPHITLAHPRNPKARGNCLASARQLPGGLLIAFSQVCVIEQHDNDAWRIIDSMPIGCTP